jgi:hypothetical protein
MDRNFLAKDRIYFEWLLDFVFHFSILPFSSWLSPWFPHLPRLAVCRF